MSRPAHLLTPASSAWPADVDPQRLHDLVAQVLERARAAGADAAEAGLTVDSGLSVNVRLGEVDTLEYHRDKGLGVTLYFGRRKGSASTTDFSPRAIAETVAAAADIARYTSEDPCAGLPDAADLAREIPDLDLYHAWDLDADAAIALARECEAAALGFDARITNSEGATLDTHGGYRVYGNTHGFLAGYASSRHSLSCTVIGEEDGAMQRDYWYTVARHPEDLEPAEAVGRHAARRTVRRLGARSMTTGRMPVLFAPEVARGLVGHFLRAINGHALYRKASFLLDHLGRPVFPDWLDMDERPHLPRALGSAPFDNEGVATRSRHLVEGGVLKGYVLDSYSARRLGLHTTGNAGGTHNVFVGDSGLDFDGLLEKMGDGLLVTELMGQGVNPVTGDYSRGAAGFRIENGTIAGPVHEITIAGNLRDMYRGIVATGTDYDRRGNVITGSILVGEMTVAGR